MVSKMDDYDVIVEGFPSSMSNMKVKIFVEKQIGKGSLKKVERQQDGHVKVTFTDLNGLRKFIDVSFKTVVFGNETYMLSCRYSDAVAVAVSQIRGPVRPSQQPHLKGSDLKSLYAQGDLTNVNQRKDGRSYPQNMAHNKTRSEHQYGAPSSGASTPLHGSSLNKRYAKTKAKEVFDPRKSVAKRHPVGNVGGENEKSLYETKHFWTDLKRLPTEGGTKCILAQNIDPAMHIQAVKMHFESNRRSGGGPVKSIVRMNDGLLIVFENDDDCITCVNTRKQEIESQPLRIFTKVIPILHERKFVVKGVSARTSVDVLKMFLERCTEDEISPSVCKKQSIPGVYLIEYNDAEFDEVDVEDFLDKISADPLEDHQLQGSRLLHSDCLKVIGVPSTASDDEIRFVLESKRRTDGGPITTIDHVKNGNVLVYFENFADAERIYNRFKQPSIEVIVICETQVTVELYYHSLSEEHKEVVERKVSKPKSKLQDNQAAVQISGGVDGSPVQLKPTCDDKIFLLIKESKNHFNALTDYTKDLGRVELNYTSAEGCLFRFIHDKKQQRWEHYNKQCMNRFQQFVSRFVTRSATFDNEKLQNARVLKLHPALQILQDKNLHPDLKVCWKDESATVEITGLKHDVEKLLGDIEDVIDANTVSIPIDEEGYRVMIHCGIIGELTQKFGRVKINCDDEKSVISITGPDRDVHQIQIEALTLRTMAKERKITDLNEFSVQYLLQNSKMAQKAIQDCISGSGIKAEFGFDSDEIYIRARNVGEYRKAKNIITSMVSCETLPVTGGRANVIKSNAWKQFQQQMMRNKSQGLYLKPDNSIIMVGMQADVRTLRTKVDTFLNENEIKRDYLQMVYGKAMFILQRSQQFSSLNPIRKAVKCGLTPEYGGGIFTEGIKQNLDAARREINKIHERTCERRHTLRDPGIKSYYLGDEGKEFLETTSRVNNCVILLNSPSCEEWIQYAREHQNEIPSRRNDNSSSVQDSHENLVTVDRDGVKLAVWKIDIIKHRCDAIVNASNKELALLSGGVSGVIKQYDVNNANQIQMEMRAIADSSVGGLMPGEAALTGAGNLPNCKKIVHAVGPRWTDRSERESKPELVLKSSIRKSLEETEKANLQSLAIPAISCGVFGGVPSVCVPLILDAVNDYFNDNKASCIKQVDFVELTNQTVLSEFKKGVLKLGKPIQTNRTKQSKQATTPISSSFLQSFVKLVQGDIAQQNVDVIVNIMAEGHVQNIKNGSAISKAIAAAAGPTVERECAQHHGKLSAGAVFKTSSGSLACQEIYHGILRNYDQTSENTVKRLVNKCLDTADRGRMKSIAFPAIGTGGFSFPPQDVAKWMKEVIGRYTPNNLKTVFIVLHQSNPAASNAFQREFASAAAAPPPPSTAAPVSNVNLPSSVKYGPLTVSVIQGDITQQKCDAIVNSTNARFDLSLGLVSTKILQQGGDEIQDEIDNDATGDFVVTTGGKLPCSNIIHMVTPHDSEDLQTKIVNLLQLADSKSFSSVAIPALGTGKLNMDSATVGLLMRAAIEAFANLNPRTLTLNKVDVIIFDNNMLPQFKEAILGTVKKGAWRKFVEGVKQWFYPTAKEEKVEILDLYLYAASEEDINRTLKCIGNETKKMMHKETIEDQTLDHLTAMENFEIMEIEKKNNVKIEYISGRYLKHLVLVGLTKNVVKACDAIRSVLRELSEAETFVQYIAWEKQASNGVWVELPSRAAHCLEKAYQEKKGKVLSEVQVMEFRFNKIAPETYDLSTLGNDPKGSNPPKIRRRPKEKGETDALPPDWDNMQGGVLKQVVLQPGSTEYQKVLNHLQRTNLQYTSTKIKIERVQSISLYKQYAAKKAEVTKKLQGTNTVVEMELFHGTANADKIISNGFDRSFAGANAAVYGNGVYFATQAAYSHGYTRPGANGMRTMFLANVITGAYAQGSGGLKTPPVKNGLDLYDSVVDRMNAPSMFVIFKDASAYPTYLISYQ